MGFVNLRLVQVALALSAPLILNLSKDRLAQTSFDKLRMSGRVKFRRTS